MAFFSGFIIGLMVGVILMCLLSIVEDNDDELEMYVEEEKDD